MKKIYVLSASLGILLITIGIHYVPVFALSSVEIDAPVSPSKPQPKPQQPKTQPTVQPKSQTTRTTPKDFEAEMPVVSQTEKKEYEELSSKNQQAKEFFEDLQVFALVGSKLAELFPKEKKFTVKETSIEQEIDDEREEVRNIEKTTSREVVVPVQEMIQAVIGSLYNISELGLALIKIADEQADPIRKAMSCLKYTNAELQIAARGKMKDEDLAKCAAAGCKNKKACLARTLMMTADATKSIFDNAIVKYDKQSNTTQRGLLLNIDYVVDNILKLLLEVPAIRSALNKKQANGVEIMQTLLKKIDSLRVIIKAFGTAFSGVLDALIIGAGIIDISAVSKEKQQEYREVFIAQQTEKAPDAKELDNLILD